MEFPGNSFDSQHVQKATHSGGDGGQTKVRGGGDEEEPRGDEIIPAEDGRKEAERKEEVGVKKKEGRGCEDEKKEHFGEEKMLATEPSVIEVAGGDGDDEDVCNKDAETEGLDGGKMMEDERSSEANGIIAKRKWDIEKWAPAFNTMPTPVSERNSVVLPHFTRRPLTLSQLQQVEDPFYPILLVASYLQ